MFDRCISNSSKKWLTLLGGFLIHFSLGAVYITANMNPYIISYLREHKGLNVRYKDNYYLTTTAAFIISLFNIFSGVLISKKFLNARLSIFIGIILMSSSVSLTYFTIDYSFFMTVLTYSILFGIGFGFAYIPPLSMAMKWFPKSRGKSNSVILFGLGLGSILLNELVTFYINPKNYSPDSPPFSEKYPDEKYFTQADLLNRVPKCFLILGAIYFSFQLVGFMLLFDKKNNQNEIDETDFGINDDADETSNLIPKVEINSLGVKYEVMTEGFEVKQVVKVKPFYLLLGIACFSYLGPSLMFSYYKIFGQTFINDDHFLALVSSTSSIFNAVSRLFWGYLIDKIPFKVCLQIVNLSMAALLSTLYLTKYMQYKEFYLIWICLLYFFFTAHTILLPTVTAKCFGQKNFNAIYGLKSMALLPGTLAAGLIASEYNEIGWFNLSMLSVGFVLIASFFGFLFKVKKVSTNDDL